MTRWSPHVNQRRSAPPAPASQLSKGALAAADSNTTPWDATARTTSTADHIPGTVPVQTYRDYFDEYSAHPEHKALGPDGKPCHPWTEGQLNPPTVEAVPKLLRIGKESLPAADDDPGPSEPIGAEIIYADRVCTVCGEALTDRQETCSDRCRKRLRGCRASR
jgi:hypothetical protein